ncbi:MAG: phytoene desaturase [Planctomycetes bacterium]|nr:phytoene desaturase [Planctomycetota bacterium]
MGGREKRVAVVGGGLGGLSAAISLLAAGYRVTLLEKNERSGGKLNLLEKDGFSFDLGPSILTLPQFFRSLFARAGRRMEEYLEIEPVTPHWRNFFEDGTVLDLLMDPRLQEKELAKLPGDPARHAAELRSFLEYSRKQYEVVERGYFARGLDNLWDFLRFYGLFRIGLRLDFRRRMAEGIARRVSEPHLQDVFEYFIKYVGSSAYNAPGFMNLMPHIQFGFDLWYAKGGMYNIARALERLCRELGGEVRLGTEVESIDRTGRRVEGVTLRGGERVGADIVVCNLEVIPAYRRLLGEGETFLRRLEKFEPSCSGLVLHLGTDRVYPQLAHHNFFYAADQAKHFASVFDRLELPEDPTIYLVAPTRTDPSKAPPGCDNLKILPHIPHLNGPNRYTPEDYAAFKERVLDKLERMGLRDLRRHIRVEHLWTPVDIERRYGSNGGSIYGVVSDWRKNRGFKAPKRSRLYRNLFFVGGSVNPGGGMPMVLLSGQKAADLILSLDARGRC